MEKLAGRIVNCLVLREFLLVVKAPLTELQCEGTLTCTYSVKAL